MEEEKSNVVEVIPRRLFWISDKNPPKGIPNAFYFNVDNDLKYIPFFSDFGPLNLAKIDRFIVELEKLLSAPKTQSIVIYHYTSTISHNRVNSAFIMGCFMIAKLGMSAESVWARFARVSPAFVTYRDASYGPCSYKCTLRHCLRGFEAGLKAGFINLQTFDLKAYEFYEKTQNGDMNWIVPGKLLAFATPYDKKVNANTMLAADYIPVFKKLGVSMVIRLNQPNYDRNTFLAGGLKHLDLIFPDGSVPSPQIIAKFLETVESEPGAIAVHCKAGLGRTGTLIGLYIMKHYHLCGADLISFLRIMRPGSILGPQQHFLVETQSSAWSNSSPIWNALSEEYKEFANSMKASDDCRPEASASDVEIAAHGQAGQGEALVNNKLMKMNFARSN